MKVQIQENVQPSSSNSDGEVIPFTADPYVVVLLQADMYANKIQTPVQEFLSNARDAHRWIDKGHIPFKVSLPNKISPVFSVRDYGPGMSRQDIESFSVLGKSTKRLSDKFTGGHGIGGKSGFAYTDSFNVISYYNGTKTTYNAFRSVENPSGGMRKEREEITSEPNGVEFQIPLKTVNDIQQFVTAVYRTIVLWETKPIISGVLAHEVPDFVTSYIINDCEFRGKDWALVDNTLLQKVTGISNQNSSTKVCFSVDGIPYGCELGSLGSNGFVSENNNKTLQEMLREVSIKTKTLVLFFDVNDIRIATSREDIERTEKTTKAVIEKMQTAKAELYAQIHDKLMVGDTVSRIKTLFKFSDSVPAQSIDALLADDKFSIDGFQFKRSDNNYKVHGDIITKNFNVSNLTLHTSRRKSKTLLDEQDEFIKVPRNTESNSTQVESSKIWNFVVVEKDCDVSMLAFREKLKLKLISSNSVYATILTPKLNGNKDEISRVKELFEPVLLSSLPRPIKAKREKSESKAVIVHSVTRDNYHGKSSLSSVHLTDKSDGKIMVVPKEEYDARKNDDKKSQVFREAINLLRDGCGYSVYVVSSRGMKGLDYLEQDYSTFDEAESIIRDYCDTKPAVFKQMAANLIKETSRDLVGVIGALHKKITKIKDKNLITIIEALNEVQNKGILVPSADLLDEYYPDFRENIKGFNPLTSAELMVADYPLLRNINYSSYQYEEAELANTIDELIVYFNLKYTIKD